MLNVERKWMNFLILQDLDKIVAILGVFFSILLTFYIWLKIGRLVYMTVSILTLLSSITWLLIRKKVSLSECDLSNRIIYKTLNVIFFILFICSIFYIHFRDDIYTRPLLYFIIISILSGIVALEILFYPRNKKNICFILFQIIGIGLNLQFSELLIFPNIVGIDPWFHQMFTLKILDTGFIPEGYSYSKLPLMHLCTGATQLITGLNYKISTMLTISFFQVSSGVFFIFLLGRYVFNKNIGLLAGLFLVTSSYFIRLGFWTIPNTIAAVLILIIVFLLFKVNIKERLIIKSLAVIFMITLILTHTISAMCMAILLFTSTIVFFIHSKKYHIHKKIPVTYTIAIFFTVSMFSWWTYASGHLTNLLSLIKWGFSVDVFNKDLPKELISNIIYPVSISEQIFNQLGMFLFFSLSFIGCFYMISRKYGTSYTFTMAIIGITPLAIGFFTLITEHSVLEARWFYFAQMLLSLPLAIAFFSIVNTRKNKYSKSMLISTLTVIISFLMIISTIANVDNTTFSPKTGVRHGFTDSELKGMQTADRLWDKTIGSDRLYANNLKWAGYNTEPICEGLYTKNFTKYGKMLILIREEITNNNFLLFNTPYSLNYEPKKLLLIQGYSKVLDFGKVDGFVNVQEY